MAKLPTAYGASAVTRLAPSPTGALHLGNARTFVLNWIMARQQGWRILLRIEDLDTPRIKPNAARQALEDLRWLGLDWDSWEEGESVLVQTANLVPYREALQSLIKRRLAYPCRCTRKEIQQAASAPHGDEHELRYPGTCRPIGAETIPPAMADFADSSPAYRLLTPDRDVCFTDQLRGPQSFNVQKQVGDFVIATKAGLPAYQLAVVVDDARQEVTDVVRGDDLLPSTARQILLYEALNLSPLPRFWHLPLVLGPDGRRLAKRHGDTRLAWYRQQGVQPQRILGLLAHWSGLLPQPTPLPLSDFLQHLKLAQIPLIPVTFTPENHAWLLQR